MEDASEYWKSWPRTYSPGSAAHTPRTTTWARLDQRRAHNMLLFAHDLRTTGELRADLDDQTVADMVWSTNSVEYFALLARRGWTPERFATHLEDLWTRSLLDPRAWREVE